MNMLGDNIRNYRKARNLSQDDLAEKLNVTRQSISLWENGQTQPSLESIVMMAKLFGVTTDDLIASDTVEAAEDEIPPEKPPRKKGWIVIAAAGAVLVLAAVFFLIFGKSLFAAEETVKPTASETASTVSDGSSSALTESETDPASSNPSSAPTASGGSPAAPAQKPASSAPAPAKTKDLFGALKTFTLNNGSTGGSTTAFIRSSDHYGGYAEENFSVMYYSSSDEIVFCLHSELDSTYCINYYLMIPKTYSGRYEYISSYNYISSGVEIYGAYGTINASDFTSNSPLPCSNFVGSSDVMFQEEFMEISRTGMCRLLNCAKNFLARESVGYSLADFGFARY